jgi:CheY-like chemotaxis protein
MRRFRPPSTPLDLRETMALVTTLARRTIGDRISIVERIAEDLWLTAAEPSLMESALLNLAIKERDAMPDGGTLTIDCRNATAHDVPANPSLAPIGGLERLLVVEDNGLVREVSCAVLADLGYAVESVESADEALTRIAKGDRFDLIFSDVTMPGEHTGISLARELHSIDPQVKIILTSGYAGPNMVGGEIRRLGVEFLPKPFRNAELAALVR